MANFNPCCCDSGCQGVIGYDLYNLQTQNFLPVYVDGEQFNSFPVKYGLRQIPDNLSLGVYGAYWAFDGIVTPEGFVVADLIENEYFTADLPFISNSRHIPFTDVDVYYKHSWNNPTNVNKDPVDSLWVNPLSTVLTHTASLARSTYDFYYGASFGVQTAQQQSTPISGAYRGWAFPRPHTQTPNFFPKHSLSYGYLKEYTHSAPVAPYLFTSQPGRFVMQTHSELPGNHYIGIDQNGHVACLPYPETDPNYWASPGNHLVPKPQIVNPNTGLPVTLKDVAHGLSPILNRATNLDYRTLMFEPFASQPLYPRSYGYTVDDPFEGYFTILSDPFNPRSVPLWPIVPEFDKGKYRFPAGFRYPQGTDYFSNDTLLFDNTRLDPLPGGTTPEERNRKVATVRFLDIWAGNGIGLPTNISAYMCPCAKSNYLYLPNLPFLNSTINRDIFNTLSGRVWGINYDHPRSVMYPWFNKNVWSYNNFTADPNDDYYERVGRDMPVQPPKYFKMPKRGKLFTGPLYPQNRWETAGATYFGKYGTRGHTNWTQAAWLTWSGNTSAPTSLLTDPENQDYFNAEVNAFKKMVDCCAKETGKGTRCINGRWETDCNDLTTQVWKARYPQQRCGGVTWDPPPPCGARKMVWAVYGAAEAVGDAGFYGDDWQLDQGIENGPPLAWGDFIIHEDPTDFKNSTYELVTRWQRPDYYKNRCYGFDVPGVNTDPGGTGINASMTWREMQGFEWTPIFPKQKSIQKQCLEDEFNIQFDIDTHFNTGYDEFFVNPTPTKYNLSSLPSNNPWGIPGLTWDIALTANLFGWFKSYKGFSAGTRPDFAERKAGEGLKWGIDGRGFRGECGTPWNWYWEEDNNNIYYNIADVGNYVWLISCSVPQYHKAKDQPLTKGLSGGFRARIDGELTGLGWSKNMGLFHPCGNVYYGVSGACGDDFFVGLTGAAKGISTKYKQCHGCTWANPPTWIGSGKAASEFYGFYFSNSLVHSSYWNLHFSFLGNPYLGSPSPNTTINDYGDINVSPCTKTLISRGTEGGYFNTAWQVGRCRGWINPLISVEGSAPTLEGTWNKEGVWTIQRFPSAYGNLTFMDYRIPYKIGAQSYTNDARVYDACKDCSNWILFGGPAIWPDPDTPV